MKLSDNIKRKLQSVLSRIQAVNILEFEPGSKIDNTCKIYQSSLKGLIQIAEDTQIKNTRISGNISIGRAGNIDGAIINGNVIFGEGLKIFSGVQIEGNIRVGRYTSISGPNTDLLSVINSIEIGSFCSVARNVSFQEYNHDFSRLTSYFIRKNLENRLIKDDVISKGSIVIGHDVWIGTQCVILSGANIGTGAVIAANSVVTGDIPPYSIVAGSPAKVIKYRFSEEMIKYLLSSVWWELPEEEIIKLHNNFKNKIE